MSRSGRSARRREQALQKPGNLSIRLVFRCKAHPTVRVATVSQQDDSDELDSTPRDYGRRDPDTGLLVMYAECPKCARPVMWTEAALRAEIDTARRAGERVREVTF